MSIKNIIMTYYYSLQYYKMQQVFISNVNIFFDNSIAINHINFNYRDYNYKNTRSPIYNFTQFLQMFVNTKLFTKCKINSSRNNIHVVGFTQKNY